MFSLALAILTIFDYWLIAEGKMMGWIVGMWLQPLWIGYAIATNQPGLILMAVVYFYINVRGWRKVSGESKRIIKD